MALTANRHESASPLALTGRQKAAIIVRLLLAEGADVPLSDLPDDLQAGLTEQMAAMRLVDRDTLRAVVAEFSALLDAVGLSFPAGLDGALTLLDGRLSTAATGLLRRRAGEDSDPWPRLAALDEARLLPALAAESTEAGAVILSKLPVAKAAELLSRLPGDRARRIATAMAQTAATRPETVRAIGHALLAQFEVEPPRAFATPPEERVGAILNAAAALTRDDVLKGLDESDTEFARRVRKAIFTFADIPARIAGRDVPKILRMVDQAQLVTALAGANGPEAAAAEFILANVSQRMAATLREEMAERGKLREKDVETAQSSLVGVIRDLVASGEMALIQDDEDQG